LALRDRMITRTQPLLEPDEKIQQVFPAFAGGNPWISSMGAMFGAVGALLLYKLAGKPIIIARTDRSLVFLAAGFNGTKPKSVLKRLPQDTPVGPLKGVWAKTMIDGQKIWIHRRFQKEATSTATV
jgi:hypothetical protein